MNGNFDAGVIDTLFADASRYRLAWLSARKRAFLQRTSNRAMGNENDDLQHRLRAELDRNKDLHLRVLDLEKEITDLKRGVGW